MYFIEQYGSLGGNKFAVSGTSNSDHPAYNAFNETYGNQDCWIPTTANKKLTIYNPIPINVTKFTIQNRTNGSQDKRVWKTGTISVNETVLVTFNNTDNLAYGNIWDIDLDNSQYSNYYYFTGLTSTYTSDNCGAIEQITLTATCKLQ